MFYSGLTYDDVGGWAFLLSTNNLKVESLLPDVHGAGTNSTFVNIALRPGVDKLTFVRQPVDASSGVFQPITNQFVDTFVVDGQIFHQDLERVVTQPDFLFFAGDTGRQSWNTLPVLRTGTTNWVNNWALNGDTNRVGPGVIVPPVNIVFHQVGPSAISQEPNPEKNAYLYSQQWGSFDESTNVPTVFPQFGLGTAHPMELRLRLYPIPNGSNVPLISYTYQLPLSIGGTVQLQTSTNVSDWLPVITVTNNGTVVEWLHYGSSQTNRFFRVVPN